MSHPIGLIWDSNSKLRSSASEPASDPRAKRRLAQVVEDELGLEDAAELAGRSVEAILRPMATDAVVWPLANAAKNCPILSQCSVIQSRWIVRSFRLTTGSKGP